LVGGSCSGPWPLPSGPRELACLHGDPRMNIFRPYSRLLFLFDLGLAVLGAVGLDAVMRAIAGPGAVVVATPGAHLPRGRPGRSWRWWASRYVAVVVVGITAFQLGRYGREITLPSLRPRPACRFPLPRSSESCRGPVVAWLAGPTACFPPTTASPVGSRRCWTPTIRLCSASPAPTGTTARCQPAPSTFGGSWQANCPRR